MEIIIILNSEEIKEAVREFLYNKYGITQEFVGEIKDLETGTPLNGGIICSGISKTTKPIQVPF